MAHKMQKVIVKGADGGEKEVALVQIAPKTAYVCPVGRYAEGVENRDLWVGFPLADVRLPGGKPLVSPSEGKQNGNALLQPGLRDDFREGRR